MIHPWMNFKKFSLLFTVSEINTAQELLGGPSYVYVPQLFLDSRLDSWSGQLGVLSSSKKGDTKQHSIIHSIKPREIKIIKTIKIPYFSIQSVYFRKSLHSTLKNWTRRLKFHLYMWSQKIKQFFSTKDKVPLPIKSGVVYKFMYEVDPRHAVLHR